MTPAASPAPEAEGLVERLLQAADRSEATGETFDAGYPSLRQIATTLQAATAREAKLRDDLVTARQNSVANTKLAHEWMVAHDMLKAGKPYNYPEQANVPDYIIEIQKLRQELRTHVVYVGKDMRGGGCDNCNAQWSGEFENHAPGCLAALEVNK